MTDIITDDLVEMVAREICPKHADGSLVKSRMPGAMYDARAALAVAVPHVVGVCAEAAKKAVSRDIEEVTSGNPKSPFLRGMLAASSACEHALRSLATPKESDR